MNYPRIIELENPKLLKLLEEKGELILQGREVSDKIADLEVSMEALDKEIQEIEKTVDVSDVKLKSEEAYNLMIRATTMMDEVKREVYDRMRPFTKDKGEEHEKLKKEKEDLETERNKFALKAQQKNDKIIPLGRKLMSQFLEKKGDDYDSIRLEGGKIVCTIFNHLIDAEKRYDEMHKS